MARPVLLVDVDGVLNVSDPGWDEGSASGVGLEEMFEVDGFTIRVPRGTRERIGRLEKVFSCMWASTWENQAPAVLSHGFRFGAHWPALRLDTLKKSATMKLPSVVDWYGEHLRPFAWVDDELHEDVDAFERELQGRFLPIRVRPEIGLTDAHVEDLEAFAACF